MHLIMQIKKNFKKYDEILVICRKKTEFPSEKIVIKTKLVSS